MSFSGPPSLMFFLSRCFWNAIKNLSLHHSSCCLLHVHESITSISRGASIYSTCAITNYYHKRDQLARQSPDEVIWKTPNLFCTHWLQGAGDEGCHAKMGSLQQNRCCCSVTFHKKHLLLLISSDNGIYLFIIEYDIRMCRSPCLSLLDRSILFRDRVAKMW